MKPSRGPVYRTQSLGPNYIMQPRYENRNAGIRTSLRAIGFIALLIGIIFAAVGLIDFFSAFEGSHHPTQFWCVFVGVPLVGLGSACLKAGYLREIGGYVAGESAPIVSDTFKYVSEELRPSIRNIAGDIREATSEENPVERMETLNQLKHKGLVSDTEYLQKRAEILKDV